VIVAQPGGPVVLATSGDAGVPERVDLLAPLRLEAPVTTKGFLRSWPLADGEIDAVRIGWPRPLTIAEPVVAAADLDDIERLHNGVVEGSAAAAISETVMET
jgi:hypothetical protein